MSGILRGTIFRKTRLQKATWSSSHQSAAAVGGRLKFREGKTPRLNKLTCLYFRAQRGPRSRQSPDPKQGYRGRLPDEALQNKRLWADLFYKTPEHNFNMTNTCSNAKQNKNPGLQKQDVQTHCLLQSQLFAHWNIWMPHPSGPQTLKVYRFSHTTTPFSSRHVKGGEHGMESGLESNVVQQKSFWIRPQSKEKLLCLAGNEHTELLLHAHFSTNRSCGAWRGVWNCVRPCRGAARQY